MPGVGGPPICLDEPVVAAAAADRRVDVLLRADELEGRARVVVEPAHERRRRRRTGRRSASRWRAHRRRSARGSRRRATRRSSARRRAPRGRARSSRRRRWSGLVARLWRASSSSTSACASSHAFEALDVRGPAVRVADRVQLQLPLGDAEPARGARRRTGSPRRRSRGRRSRSPRARAASARGSGRGCGAAVAVHRGDRVELHRLRLAVQAVLEVGARDRRGALGPQRERAAAAVRRRCTSPFARRRSASPDVRAKSSVSSKTGVWIRAVAVERGQLLHRRGRRATSGWSEGRTSCVPRGAWNSVAARAQLGEERVARRARRPSVVGGPWPE